MPTFDFTKNWRIVIKKSGDEVAWLAATELQETLQHITGSLLPMSTHKPADSSVFVLTHDNEPDDGFSWHVEKECIVLHGHNPRGLLYAVYSFLEALGCRWLAPGKQHTRLPQQNKFDLPNSVHQETPALVGRCLVLGHHAFMRNAADWVIWAARNRLNTIFFHVIESSFAFGAAPESQYQFKKETVIRLAHQRGMSVEHGGHGMTSLLPRRLFKQVPEAFRMHQGKRTPDHNFCPTSPEGLAFIRHNASAYFVKHPEVDVFHLWADDILGGGWCDCPQCRDYSPSEQLMLATNIVAEVLQYINPNAQISYLAYHDTEQIPARVLPRSNVCLLWAPRKRCYAHAVDNADCMVNVPHYNETLSAQVQFMQSNGAAPARVFEYYLDGILFKSVLPPLLNVMQQDLRFYRNAGVHTVQALMTADRPWHTAELNPWIFTRLAWNPDQDIKVLVNDFSQAFMKADLWAYFHALESAYALALDLVPEQIKLDKPESSNPLTVWNIPPSDMGDPVDAPLEILQNKVEKNDKILSLLKKAEGRLKEAQANADAQTWQLEWEAFNLHYAWLTFDLSRVKLYAAVASNPLPHEGRKYLNDAQKAMNCVFDWGNRYISDARYRKNFRLMRLLYWQMRMSKIRAVRFSIWPVRVWIAFKSLIQLLVAKEQTRNIYE